MFTLLGIAFTTPWLLLGLVALPILWILLRAVPPAPIRRLFPGVALLLGLQDDESHTDKTPWWLLLIRTLAIAAIIIGFAGPVLNPKDTSPATGPLLILTDASWASARDWPQRIGRIEAALAEAGRTARPVALISLSELPAGGLPFQTADTWRSRLPGFQPHPWAPDPGALQEWAGGLEGTFDTFWFSDGLARDGRLKMLASLEARGNVKVFESPRPVFGLRPARFEDGTIRLTAVRARTEAQDVQEIRAFGLDPAGIERELVTARAEFDAGSGLSEVELSVPAELRNRISRFAIRGVRSAGAISLTDDSLKRREVALISAGDAREALELLSPTHYLEQALQPTADLIDGTLHDILLANPDAIILADVATLSPAEAEAITTWVDDGGLLVRFAGPRLAASDVSRDTEDILMPVRLRAGGRRVGGAMSWGEPKSLRRFQETSPFFGLTIPDDVRVSAQVMAQPDPNLSGRVIASLTDGTPLVTRKNLGQGQVVLFHVTANADWSTLPLSGLFVQMLERLAISTRPARPDAADLAGTIWVPTDLLDAFGEVQDAGTMAGIAGEELVAGQISAQLPPGLYAGEDRRLALNVIGAEDALGPVVWPVGTRVEGMNVARETLLKGFLLCAALAFLAIDLLASLWLSGRLSGRQGLSVASVFVVALMVAPRADAQSDEFALNATSEVVLAYIITGDSKVDDTSLAGLRGLSDALFARTSIEPAEPMAINLETDELSFFPMLYWPVTPEQPLPSLEAYVRLNRYLRTGGMIVFDTRDANIARFGTSSPNGRKLQKLARPLDIPPLEPIPNDHVLTRTFYLLQDFPGRFLSRDVWVQAAPPDAELLEGMPFRNLNDNVTPVVIGGNDWAGAWAVGRTGNMLFPVGRGVAGERQREIAYRFGVNLVMHVLTGNYKSDQVHVPALLERLGQ
ncbi:MAG: DUF4159 domain-containing protein [Marinosulfonomonas sp.]|nr:DUF4159 domain-containing protein [Marinosulfonomonas sp.]